MDDECRRVLDELVVFLDRGCPDNLRRVVHTHVEACPTCRQRVEFEARFRAFVANSCKDHAPAGLLERVVSRLGLRDER